jgi:hypothetical protein
MDLSDEDLLTSPEEQSALREKLVMGHEPAKEFEQLL